MKSRSFRTALASLLILFCVSSFANATQSDSLNTIVELGDGSSFEGRLEKVDSDTAVFTVDGTTKVVSADMINRVQFSNEAGEPSGISNSIVLVDGSELFCQAFTVENRELIAETESEIPVRINSRLVDHVRFPSADREFKKSWITTTKHQRESDALVVNKNQKLQVIDGVIGGVSAESVSFTVGDRTADVKRSRLAGIMFYRRIADEFTPPVFVLRLVDGCSIEVQSMKLENGKFQIRSVAGAQFFVGADSISTLDFSSKREMWLTDLEPATNDWTPLMAGSSILGSLKKFSLAKIDKGFHGKPLATLNRSEDESWKRQEFAKGFAIKGGGKLSFLLAKQFQSLSGFIAFDPDANSAGVVKLIVQVDGRNRIETVLDASKMKKPLPIEIDLADADRIVFQVDYHDRRSVGDILHAVNMKLVR